MQWNTVTTQQHADRVNLATNDELSQEDSGRGACG